MDIGYLREQLAAIEHERWSDWQRWCHAQGRRTADGELVIPAHLVTRWERQAVTPYADLSEREKASDREQVDRYWPLIAAILADRERRPEAARVKALEAALLNYGGHHPECPSTRGSHNDDRCECGYTKALKSALAGS